MVDATHPLGLGKACPRCGKRSNTLGGVCPACGKPYVRGGLVDRLPFMDDGYGQSGKTGFLLVLAGFGVLALWAWLLVTHLVAGILLGAAVFVALVAAIGAVNAAESRRL